jgi:hypothetical protein
VTSPGVDVDLAEYDRLRQEVDNRTQIANGLVGLELTALGVGLASAGSLPEVIIGLAVVSAFLWMLWVDHAGQIWKIAAYTGIDLGSRLRRTHPDALGWERFLRRLDRGGDEARRVLRLPAGARALAMPKTTNVGLYISLIFGGSPLVLLAVSLISLFDDDMDGVGRGVRVAAITGALVVWVLALRAFRQFRRLAATIDAAIESSMETGIEVSAAVVSALPAAAEAPRDADA